MSTRTLGETLINILRSFYEHYEQWPVVNKPNMGSGQVTLAMTTWSTEESQGDGPQPGYSRTSSGIALVTGDKREMSIEYCCIDGSLGNHLPVVTGQQPAAFSASKGYTSPLGFIYVVNVNSPMIPLF